MCRLSAAADMLPSLIPEGSIFVPEVTVSMLYSVGILIALPALFIVLLWKTAFKSKLAWLLDSLATTAFMVWLFQAGNWSW
jgi:hypothetical protein